MTIAALPRYSRAQVMSASPIVVSLVTLLLVAFLLWFALGTQRNIRKGNDVLRWLQGGLPELGSRTTLRWLGSSVVELKISQARAPFSEATVMVVLEPRDVSVLWALARARRRRDFLVMRARLRRAPAFELEAGRAGTFTGRDRLDRLDPEAWSTGLWEHPSVEVAHTAEADVAAVRALWDAFGSSSGQAWRISVRRDAPHVEVHTRLPDIDSVDPRELLGAFQR
ncbi:MAG: hypothetical protein ACRDJ5_07380, partial [Actinomycetota bacterium]